MRPAASPRCWVSSATCAARGLERSLIDLVNLRASQINGCAYCIDMHWKDLRAGGETEQRLYSLDAWRECPYISTDRQPAALAWTESLTLIHDGHAADAVFARVRPHFTEKELADLTLAIAAINTWNRLNIAARTDPGTYQPGALSAVLSERIMADAPTDTDVLIVGAGPVGLFLANECARRGLRYRIVETHATSRIFEGARNLPSYPRNL